MKKLLVLTLAIVLMCSSAAFACDSCGCSADKAGESSSHMQEGKMEKHSHSEAGEAGSMMKQSMSEEAGMGKTKAIEKTNMSTKEKAKEASSY